MWTLGYVLGNMGKTGAGIYEGATNFVEQKQVEWKSAWTYYGDVSNRILFMCMKTHHFLYILCNK